MKTKPSLIGTTVRLPKGKRTATVMNDRIVIGGQSVDGGVRLDKPLGGHLYWNIEDLVAVKKPKAELVKKKRKCIIFLSTSSTSFNVWNVVASNGRHLCECYTKSAAKKIKAALDGVSE